MRDFCDFNMIAQKPCICKAFYLYSALKGKFLHSLPYFSKFTFSTFFTRFEKFSTSIAYTSALVFFLWIKFSFPPWQASLPLLYLSQLTGTLCVSFLDISSLSVSCRAKLPNSSEDIFFCLFFIPLSFRKNHSYSCFTISDICVIR